MTQALLALLGILLETILYPVVMYTVYCTLYYDCIIIIIIIILLKLDYKVQLANNKILMAWLTSWLVVG